MLLVVATVQAKSTNLHSSHLADAFIQRLTTLLLKDTTVVTWQCWDLSLQTSVAHCLYQYQTKAHIYNLNYNIIEISSPAPSGTSKIN